MRIITDSAADFTREELLANDIRCVYTSVIFGSQVRTADDGLTDEEFCRHRMHESHWEHDACLTRATKPYMYGGKTEAVGNC